MLHIWVGLSSRSIFNDLFAVIRLFQPPCALRSSAPHLLGFAYGQPPFSGLATEQRLAPRYFPRPSARRRCSVVCFPARKVSVSNTTLQVNRKLTIRHKLVYKKITPGKTARYGGSVYSLKMTVSGGHDRPAGQSVKLAPFWTVYRQWRNGS